MTLVWSVVLALLSAVIRYSNVPGEWAGPLGLCGGGAYRQIEVYVDGIIAGLAYPFPVVYTGGINPLLWRPLTGVFSFNVPPYEFDLTPFAGRLNDGRDHVLGIRVSRCHLPTLYMHVKMSNKKLEARRWHEHGW